MITSLGAPSRLLVGLLQSSDVHAMRSWPSSTNVTDMTVPSGPGPASPERMRPTGRQNRPKRICNRGVIALPHAVPNASAISRLPLVDERRITRR